MNQTKHCWQNYVDYHKCILAKGEDFAPCRQFWLAYRSLCPSGWYARWDEQRGAVQPSPDHAFAVDEMLTTVQRLVTSQCAWSKELHLENPPHLDREDHWDRRLFLLVDVDRGEIAYIPALTALGPYT